MFRLIFCRSYESQVSKLRGLLESVPAILSSLEGPKDWAVLHDTLSKLYKYRDTSVSGALPLPLDLEDNLFYTLGRVRDIFEGIRSQAKSIGQYLAKYYKSS